MIGYDDYAGSFSGITDTGKLVHNEVDSKLTMQNKLAIAWRRIG